jgi:hypothetical protein
MKISFTALICGGYGDKLFEREEQVKGEDMTISEALSEIEEMLNYSEVVVRIEQDE